MGVPYVKRVWHWTGGEAWQVIGRSRPVIEWTMPNLNLDALHIRTDEA